MLFLRLSVHPACMTISERGVQTRRVPSPADFGTRLAMVRQYKGWNITEAARECRLKEATWRTWEEGARPRDYEKVCRSIAFTSGIDLIWLLTGQTPADVLDRDFRGQVNSDRDDGNQNLKLLVMNESVAA